MNSVQNRNCITSRFGGYARASQNLASPDRFSVGFAWWLCLRLTKPRVSGTILLGVPNGWARMLEMQMLVMLDVLEMLGMLEVLLVFVMLQLLMVLMMLCV